MKGWLEVKWKLNRGEGQIKEREKRETLMEILDVKHGILR